MKVFLVYPHQLFEESAIFTLLDTKRDIVILVEDPLFFTQYNFHAKKLLFHQRTMYMYKEYIKENGYNVHYIASKNIHKTEDIARLIDTYIDKKLLDPLEILVYDPVDNWLEKKLRKVFGGTLTLLETPMFINTTSDNRQFFSGKKPFMKSFYEWQRKRLDILMEANGKPVGGKFSFDTENRKKLPKGYTEPKHGDFGLDDDLGFATDFAGAKKILHHFLRYKLKDFGIYEDSISSEHIYLNHSILSPYLNVGILTPEYVVRETLQYCTDNEKEATQRVPLNSLEGFLRQIVGWREFIRAMYVLYGSKMRTTNFFNHTKKLPYTFWTATTKNEVVDNTIQKVLRTAYTHHIERLMIIGNYMLLSEYDPDAVYRWFMEMYIDAYDWVMVPNVYGMSQFADGGIFATKPYISGSNYILKMSNYTKGTTDDSWDKEWDAKFWAFLEKHRAFFSKNIRFKMLLSMLDKRKSTT
ncbi:MAG: cryptochrome/photolyase family protein [Candidatus Pacebacteria bacterium]|jgi:deoxyribodipyrimidine photolyase-related protein|nr:cryptochrome/photolyase family protein [Candidatus Paceibacterota bacterium]